MKNIWTTCIVTAFSVLAFLMPTGRTFAATGISDSANFFSPDAESKAKSAIDDIARKHHQQVYIETVLAVPDGTTYAQYTDERTRAARVDGVYVLIVKKGGHVHVGAAQETARLFTNDTRTQLAKQIETDMRKGEANFDAALANAMTFISDVYNRGERQPGGTAAPRTNTNSTVPPPPPVTYGRGNGGNTGSTISTGGFFHTIWGWVCLGVGIWVIIGLVRSVMAGRGGGGYGGGGPGYGGGGPGYGYGGGGYGGGGYGYGGGGFGSSLLGGLFGAAAGSWLYDRFSGGSSSYGQQVPPSSGGYGGTQSGPTSPDWQGPSDTGQGYESSDAGGGADFGGGGGGSDASSGADFGGGGDSGGGGSDFGGGGGGDFGGGGGDAGGGGDF